jgi:cytosine/adenosine deaminase-related metal-dependent hydrolase
MATLHPAKLVGLTPNRLEVGDVADLALFRLEPAAPGEVSQLAITATLTNGVLERYSSP